VYLIRHGKLLSWKDAPPGGLAEVVLEGPDPWAQLRMTPQQIKDSVDQLQGTSREYQAKVLDAQVENSKASPSRRYRLLLDPKVGFAVKEQWDETFSKELLLHTVCEDFEKLPNRSVWLPKTCRTLAHAHENLPAYVSAKPIYETVVTLKSVSEKEFSDKDFQLWYDSPGGDVFDYTAEGATRAKPVNYKVPGTVANLGKVSENSNAKTGMRTWILIGNAAILLLLIGFVLVSRHRRAK
jgi:hypothetical protein